MTYAEKLKDPRWQKKRLKVLEYAQWRCQICGSKSKTLHVHHSYYLRGKEPWQYPDGSLISVCNDCHDKIHPEKKKSPPQPPHAEMSPDAWLPAPRTNAEIHAEICRLTRMKRPLISGWMEEGTIIAIENGTLLYSFPKGRELARDYISHKSNKAFIIESAASFGIKINEVICETFMSTKERFGSIFAAIDRSGDA